MRPLRCVQLLYIGEQRSSVLKASSDSESDVQKTREARFYRFLLKRSNGSFLQSEYIQPSKYDELTDDSQGKKLSGP